MAADPEQQQQAAAIAKIPVFNVLVAGSCGVGKSSMFRFIFNIDIILLLTY
jgi:predicted GTPase